MTVSGRERVKRFRERRRAQDPEYGKREYQRYKPYYQKYYQEHREKLVGYARVRRRRARIVRQLWNWLLDLLPSKLLGKAR